MRLAARLRQCVALLLLAGAMCGAAPTATPIAAPPENRRGEDQTFLTFPEWYLVYSPAEYAVFVRDRAPSEFPYWGHVSQLWHSYGAVIDATRRYEFNAEYHVMIVVISVSTTIEYAMRSAYETLIGRVGELFSPAEGTPEDEYAARVAQDYVEFIRVRPWYEFDFTSRLLGLWRDTPVIGPGLLRKWERRYALTTEYAVKAVYGWLLGLGTQSTYGAESPVTVVVLNRAPAETNDIKTLRGLDDGRWLGTLPRYDAFKDHALAVARTGIEFQEIAGNGTAAPLLVSIIVPAGWQAKPELATVLFEQTIITEPGRRRVVLVVTVATFSGLLRFIDVPGVELEHVYDY